MRIALFDGAEEPGPMDPWLDAVEAGLAADGHAVRRFRLRERTLCQCKGCFECWVKTPGRCGVRDGAAELLQAMLGADLLVLASPTVMGMTTALTRRALERMLPTLHPHFEVTGGELHHRARYPRRAKLALLYGADGLDAEDEALLLLLHQRLAVNMRSSLACAASTARPPEEVCHALARA